MPPTVIRSSKVAKSNPMDCILAVPKSINKLFTNMIHTKKYYFKDGKRISAEEGHNIVALCDVDWAYKSVLESFSDFPDAQKYRDFRKMLDKE